MEMAFAFKDILLLNHILVKIFQLNVGFFTQDKHCAAMVRLYAIVVGEMRHHKLENEDGFVSEWEIELFMLLKFFLSFYHSFNFF